MRRAGEVSLSRIIMMLRLQDDRYGYTKARETADKTMAEPRPTTAVEAKRRDNYLVSHGEMDGPALSAATSGRVALTQSSKALATLLDAWLAVALLQDCCETNTHL